MTAYARAERLALADDLATLGPDAPTLCTGWTTRDLAAHIVVRERRPDAAIGITVPRFSGRTRTVQDRVAARAYATILADVRKPPVWSIVSNPLLDELVNVSEMFIHHEDVRRAQPGWSPRPLADGLQAALWRRVRTTARFGLRKLAATVTLDAGGHGTVTVGGGGPRVTAAGDPGELTMFFSGRQAYARVELTGDRDMITRLSGAKLGV
ncbi:TIGR03085 family metal-binding protein [Hamadaea tsunoensis]|uniref:TIGR03085 family metal-binding protein n=1 Tax=Hamadaea tsunoensis TaxID=53368 RepID=UPI0004847CA4|nr:TIGR03085 family metal-binding protein [Hamadaea tsunoensis]